MGALWKIPFNLADYRVLGAGIGLVAVLIGTLPHGGGGRVLAVTDVVWSGMTLPIAISTTLRHFLQQMLVEQDCH
jgi:hypothetical protein